MRHLNGAHTKRNKMKTINNADQVITIEAQFPAKSIRSSPTCERVYYPARTDIFELRGGEWSNRFGRVSIPDVISGCRYASNWQEIRAAHFPMEGFAR